MSTGSNGVIGQSDAEVEWLVANGIKNFNFAHGQGAFGSHFIADEASLDRFGRDQLEIVRGDDLVVGPNMICGKVFPAKIQIEEAEARIALSISRGKQFDFVFEFPLSASHQGQPAPS